MSNHKRVDDATRRRLLAAAQDRRQAKGGRKAKPLPEAVDAQSLKAGHDAGQKMPQKPAPGKSASKPTAIQVAAPADALAPLEARIADAGEALIDHRKSEGRSTQELVADLIADLEEAQTRELHASFRNGGSFLVAAVNDRSSGRPGGSATGGIEIVDAVTACVKTPDDNDTARVMLMRIKREANNTEVSEYAAEIIEPTPRQPSEPATPASKAAPVEAGQARADEPDARPAEPEAKPTPAGAGKAEAGAPQTEAPPADPEVEALLERIQSEEPEDFVRDALAYLETAFNRGRGGERGEKGAVVEDALAEAAASPERGPQALSALEGEIQESTYWRQAVSVLESAGEKGSGGALTQLGRILDSAGDTCKDRDVFHSAGAALADVGSDEAASILCSKLEGADDKKTQMLADFLYRSTSRSGTVIESLAQLTTQ